MNPLANPEEFQRWKDHPMTEAWFQYLEDYRESLKEQWARGVNLPPAVQPQADLMGQLCLLTSEHIKRFYEGDDDQ